MKKRKRLLLNGSTIRHYCKWQLKVQLREHLGVPFSEKLQRKLKTGDVLFYFHVWGQIMEFHNEAH